jgi:glycosyltransferase involved in cell wall biosynthesis
MAGLAAIQYAAEAFDLRVSKLMGRQVAGQTFLEAWVRYSGADPLTSWTADSQQRDAFEKHVRELGATVAVASAQNTNLPALKEAGALWLADPSLAQYAWLRRWHQQTDWSIVGITHTLSTHAAMDRLVELVRAPIQPWDALICTSKAARDMVMTVLRAEAEYLNARTGAHRFALPQLPVIPLGVHCAALRPNEADRTRWRRELGLAQDDVALLQFGRLAIHAKAHPTPLYEALAEVARRTGRRMHLIFAGKFVNEVQEQLYRRLAGEMSSVVVTHFVDGARGDAPNVRAAADIGILLSDNVQETFGLAPVELMAAGLPVVGSDWDGLRDTIEHGVTGFRAETRMPQPGVGELLAYRYATLDPSDAFVGGAAQSTMINVGQVADALEKLVVDRELRLAMGEAGRQRAEAVFDWSVIIPAYCELLRELEQVRATGEEVARRGEGKPANPAQMDPFLAFRSYASDTITEALRIRRAPDAPRTAAEVVGGLEMALMNPFVLPSVAELDALIVALGDEALGVRDLVHRIPDLNRGKALAGVGWLLKFGYARPA